jgi:hypothetical protein
MIYEIQEKVASSNLICKCLVILKSMGFIANKKVTAAFFVKFRCMQPEGLIWEDKNLFAIQQTKKKLHHEQYTALCAATSLMQSQSETVFCKAYPNL